MIFLMKESKFKVCPLRDSGSFVSDDEGLLFVVFCWFFLQRLTPKSSPNITEEKRKDSTDKYLG